VAQVTATPNDIAAANKGRFWWRYLRSRKNRQGFRFDEPAYISVPGRSITQGQSENSQLSSGQISAQASQIRYRTIFEKANDYLIWWEPASKSIQYIRMSSCTGGYHMGVAASFPNLAFGTWHHFRIHRPRGKQQFIHVPRFL